MCTKCIIKKIEIEKKSFFKSKLSLSSLTRTSYYIHVVSILKCIPVHVTLANHYLYSTTCACPKHFTSLCLLIVVSHPRSGTQQHSYSRPPLTVPFSSLPPHPPQHQNQQHLHSHYHYHSAPRVTARSLALLHSHVHSPQSTHS